MVIGEPDDVRVERIDRRWAVLVTEQGKLTRHPFDTQAEAEAFADEQRTRLGLPAKPPVDDPRTP